MSDLITGLSLCHCHNMSYGASHTTLIVSADMYNPKIVEKLNSLSIRKRFDTRRQSDDLVDVGNGNFYPQVQEYTWEFGPEVDREVTDILRRHQKAKFTTNFGFLDLLRRDNKFSRGHSLLGTL